METLTKTYYEVRTLTFETTNGLNAVEQFNNSSNQDTQLEQRFETLDEAREFYKTIATSCTYCPYNRVYRHTCKLIEENSYELSEDGEEEWIAGGDWWEFEFPDKPEEVDDDDEEE